MSELREMIKQLHDPSFPTAQLDLLVYEVTAWHDRELARVIGEDENPHGTRMIGVPSVQRDQLRAEQRKRAGI